MKRQLSVDWANWIDEADLEDDEEDDVDETDVKVLKESNFDSFIEANKIALVEFYAPWCGHCKSLKPEYAKAATQLKDAGSIAKLAKVDATKEPSLASRFGVNGYPMLKVFRNGKPTEFKGGRTAEEIKEYMLRATTPSVKDLHDVDAVKTFTKEAKAAMVLFSSADPTGKAKEFEEVADALREDFAFARTTADASAFGVEGKDKVVLFKPYDEKQVVYDKQLVADDVETWLWQNALPRVGDLTTDPELGQKYARRNLPMVYFFVDPKAEATKGVLEIADATAKAHAGKYSVAQMDATSEVERMKDLGIEPKKSPQVVIDSADGKLHYSANFKAVADVTHDAMDKFIADHKAGNLKPSIKSATPPTPNDGPVKVVVGSTFDEIVMDEKKDVLIEFYAPWCGHCKQLAPVYEELGKKVSKSAQLTIANFDATANDIPNSAFNVEGFPTIYFKPAGKAPKDYQGGRGVKDFVEYLKKEATHPVTES